MSDADFLLWVRGPAFEIASSIFVLGVMVRILEMVFLGRQENLAKARGSAIAGGFRTLVTRSIPDGGTLKRSAFVIVAGYLFHIGLFITIFLFAPHILVFESVFGFSWPFLPTPIVDATAVVTLIALMIVLLHRVRDPVMRFLSGFQDYLVWLVTFLPLVTGYIAFHRIGAAPSLLIAAHILSVELLLILFPFTKLMHAFTLFMARWYNGAMSGYKGVKS